MTFKESIEDTVVTLVMIMSAGLLGWAIFFGDNTSSSYEVAELSPHEEYSIESASTTQELAILINYYASIDSVNQTFIENLVNSGYIATDAVMTTAVIYQKENEVKLAKVKMNYNTLLAEGQLDELKDTSDIIIPELELEPEVEFDYNFEEENFESDESFEWTDEEEYFEEEVTPDDEKYKGYPTAYTVWKYLTENIGLNNFVSAGILGNMMSECGGQTLSLQASVYGGSGAYYGICQWNSTYYPSVQGVDLDSQLDFLKSTIEKEIDTYGKNYATGFKYVDFVNLTNCGEAALAFAKAYERCGTASHSKRVENAQVAYDFFTS